MGLGSDRSPSALSEPLASQPDAGRGVSLLNTCWTAVERDDARRNKCLDLEDTGEYEGPAAGPEGRAGR